jgi:glycerate 2-kinase
MTGAQVAARHRGADAADMGDFSPIANAAGLTGHGLAELRRVALDVTATGLRAADPGAAVNGQVAVDGHMLRVAGRSFDLDAFDSVVVLGAGKATMPVAAALEVKLGDRISRGLVVRRVGEVSGLRRVEVIDADHPIPSQASLTAGQRLLELARSCGPRDLVITAFTGGSSALACVPPDGVTLAAKQALHTLLLDSGASIAEVNAVRKHVSAVKGGRLAAQLGGATIVNLTLSDVVGDAVDLICDLVVQDTTEVSDAVAVLERYGLWDAVSPQIRRHLSSAEAASPSLSGADITTAMLVTGSMVAAQMADRVRALGRQAVVLGSTLEGDAVSLGRLLGSLARESAVNGQPFAAGSVLVAAGGEATVAIQRSGGITVGSGGPNQELALAFAGAIDGHDAPIAGVFVDSDGSDGGTRAAGGCVDSETMRCADQLGVDVPAAIARHDSTTALERIGDLVLTGPTGTNISDLIVVVTS